MEIADNQHPIDLSRKCGYYEKPQRYMKPGTGVSSSRPLPDLIPISSLLHDTSSSKKDVNRSPFTDHHAREHNQYGFPAKERSVARKELARQRSMPHLASASKMRKSNSDTRIPFLRIDSPPEHSSFSNYLSVPTHHSGIMRPEARKYADKGLFHNSSCLTPTNKIDNRYVDDEVSSSLHSHSKKYMKQGPGVSLSTIQSLRKLLDKRKSMQKE